MGCQTSRVNVCASSAPRPSSAGTDRDHVLRLLKDENEREVLQEFISNKWDGIAGEALCATDLRRIASNFIDFWLDTDDFSRLVPGPFQVVRGRFLYEHYLMYGAPKLIPVGPVLIEDIVATLHRTDRISHSVFDVAKEEVVDFLSLEVMPKYTLRVLANHPTKSLKHVAESITATQHKLTRNASRLLMMQADADQMKKTFAKLMGDPEYLQSFKQFLRNDQTEGILLMHNDVIELQEKFQSRGLDLLSDDVIALSDHFLEALNVLYQEYISDCGAQMLHVRKSTLETIKHSMAHCSGLDLKVLDNIKEILVDALQRTLAQYLNSPEYRLLFRKGRRSLATLIPLPAYPSFVHIDKNEANAMASELLAYLQSTHIDLLQRYLDKQGDGHLLRFWIESEHIRTTVYRHDAERLAAVQRCFAMYFNRNSDFFIPFSEALRMTALTGKQTGDQNVFMQAQERVLEVLLNGHWPLFKRSYKDITVPPEPELHESQHGTSLNQLQMHSRQDNATPDLFATPAILASRNAKGRADSIGSACTELAEADQNQDRNSALWNDVPLEKVLQHPYICSCFKSFLQGSYTAATVLFWVDAEDFKRLPTSLFAQARCRKIYNRYLAEHAPMKVPISEACQRTIASKLQVASPTHFLQAQAEVLEYMQEYQYPAFQSTFGADIIERLYGPPEEATTSRAINSAFSAPVQSVEFNNLVRVLAHPLGARFFKEFCVEIHCTENILFWLEAEDYLRIPGMDYMEIFGRKLFHKYISERARQQVNLPAFLREDISNQRNNPTRNMFRKAQTEVLRLMERDTFPKFKHSAKYKQLTEMCGITPDRKLTPSQSLSREHTKNSPPPSNSSFMRNLSGRSWSLLKKSKQS